MAHERCRPHLRAVAAIGGVIKLELPPSPIPPFLAQLHAPQRLVRRDPRVAAAEGHI